MRERDNLKAMQAWFGIIEAIRLTYPQKAWIKLWMSHQSRGKNDSVSTY
jgi:hypothetical protein